MRQSMMTPLFCNNTESLEFRLVHCPIVVLQLFYGFFFPPRAPYGRRRGGGDEVVVPLLVEQEDKEFRIGGSSHYLYLYLQLHISSAG